MLLKRQQRMWQWSRHDVYWLAFETTSLNYDDLVSHIPDFYSWDLFLINCGNPRRLNVIHCYTRWCSFCRLGLSIRSHLQTNALKSMWEKICCANYVSYSSNHVLRSFLHLSIIGGTYCWSRNIIVVRKISSLAEIAIRKRQEFGSAEYSNGTPELRTLTLCLLRTTYTPV